VRALVLPLLVVVLLAHHAHGADVVDLAKGSEEPTAADPEWGDSPVQDVDGLMDSEGEPEDLGEDSSTPKAKVDEILSRGAARLAKVPLEINLGEYHEMIKELSAYLPEKEKQKELLRLGEDADPPTGPAAGPPMGPGGEDPMARDANATAAAIAECDKLATFAEKAACIEDAKRFKPPACEFQTDLFHQLLQMNDDPVFMRQSREKRSEQKQKIIADTVSSYKKVSDTNQNGTIEPDELKSLVDKLTPMMNDNAQLGKCTYTAPKELGEAAEATESDAQVVQDALDSFQDALESF
jgi:hypothetical protein